RSAENDCCPQDRMPGEGRLVTRLEDPDAGITAALGWIDKRDLREVRLPRNWLEELLRDLCGIREHRELITSQWLLGEDVTEHERKAPRQVGHLAIALPQFRVTQGRHRSLGVLVTTTGGVIVALYQSVT